MQKSKQQLAVDAVLEGTQGNITPVDMQKILKSLGFKEPPPSPFKGQRRAQPNQALFTHELLPAQHIALPRTKFVTEDALRQIRDAITVVLRENPTVLDRFNLEETEKPEDWRSDVRETSRRTDDFKDNTR